MTFHHSTFVHITELQKILRTEIYKEFLGVEKSTGKENCMLFVCNMMHNALIVTSFESSHWNFEKTGHTLRYSNLLYMYTFPISCTLFQSAIHYIIHYYTCNAQLEKILVSTCTCIAIGWGVSTVCDGISRDTPPECLKASVLPSGWIISVSFLGILTM